MAAATAGGRAEQVGRSRSADAARGELSFFGGGRSAARSCRRRQLGQTGGSAPLVCAATSEPRARQRCT
jgi:hypothetical protein